MAASEFNAEAEATIYDDEGRTRIPNDVRDALGWKEGDKVRMVVMNGHLYVNKVVHTE
mgnify:FL=1